MADAWTWSPAHNDYYLYTYENGTPVYHWAKQQQPQQLQQPALSEPSRSVPRHDSPILPSTLLSSPDPSYPEGAGLYYTTTEQGYSSRPSNTPHTTHQSYPSAPNYPSGGGAYPANSSLPTTQAAESQPHAHHQGYYLTQSTRPSLGNVNDAYPPQPESATAGGPLEELPALAIRGTPGETEKLDPEYRVRNSRFFARGKMFALLFSEAMGNNNQLTDNANVSTVMYGQYVYSQIRRFVVVQERRGFCYACPIFTYGGRATMKSGVDPSEHAIIHINGTPPRLLLGEAQLEKQPIAVMPARSDVKLALASRINFGIQHPIQHNVKVKDLGDVREEDMPKLIGYWRIERNKELSS